jgi:hypothetical protein
MQVLCKKSEDDIQARCSVCGQGFTLYWERQTPAERADALEEVHATLIAQHGNKEDAGVHPDGCFLVPSWGGDVAFSGAAILGNAPNSMFSR